MFFGTKYDTTFALNKNQDSRAGEGRAAIGITAYYLCSGEIEKGSAERE